MRTNNSLNFIRAFLCSLVIATPFLIKQIPFVREKLEADENDDILIELPEDLANVSNMNSNTNQNDTNTNSNSNSNSSTNTNTNSNTNTNTNSNSKPSNSNSTSNTNPPSKKPSVQNASFVKVDDSYFDDALFIGDSRTVGIKEYGKLKNAAYFCDTGMSIYNIDSKKLSVSGVGKVTLKELLKKKKYGKIYIMLGINEIGYNIDKSYQKFKETVNYIHKEQPNAIIFIQANLHVTKEKSEKGPTFNNKRIDSYNTKLSTIADNKTIFYFDANSLFDDGKGNLKKDYTFDNTHIYAKYYVNWTNYIKEHGIVINSKDEVEEPKPVNEEKKEENSEDLSNSNSSNEENI